MANICSNIVIVKGLSYQIDKFLKHIKVDDHGDRILDGDTLLPIPEGSDVGKYEWRVKAWGVKCSPYNVSVIDNADAKVEPGKITNIEITFDTPWCSPIGLLAIACMRYNLTMRTIFSDGEGCNTGSAFISPEGYQFFYPTNEQEEKALYNRIWE